MRKIYLDKTELSGGCISLYVSDAEIIPAGTTVYSMNIGSKNEEYQRYADTYDIHFIFDDDVPELDFYTVPQVDILAKDSEGGFIGTIGQESDLDSDAPICYINNRKECFIIAKSGKEFINKAASWKCNMEPYSDITFYNSKSEVEKELEFFDISSLQVDGCGPDAYAISNDN